MNDGDAFVAALSRKAKLLAPAAVENCEAHPDLAAWVLDPLARWAKAAYGEGIFDDAARGYAQYCMHVAKARRVYEKEGRYTPEALDDIVTHVYSDDAEMVPYMWAAILVYAFWPSMVGHVGVYRDQFLGALRSEPRILEMASGHGVLGLLAAEHRSDATVEGLDISVPAVAIARRLAEASGLAERVSFQVCDVLDLNVAGGGGDYQGVVAAMLAEHLADPGPLFRSVAHHLAPDGLAFVSTAIESAQRDHVFEFRRESEPVLLAEAAGLRVVHLISHGSSRDRGLDVYPRALAMILEKHR